MQTKRLVSQIIFFAIFLVLMVLNKAQIWMALIFTSILLAAFFGRYYCGWICPINTTLRLGNAVGKALKSQKSYIPKSTQLKSTRRLITGFFIAALAYTVYTISIGDKFPLPVIIISLGFVSTVFINEQTWHRYLCPWGILFSLTAKFSKRGMKVIPSGCVACSKCIDACPAEAVEIKNGKAEIDMQYCLTCYKCSDTCKVNTIHFK